MREVTVWYDVAVPPDEIEAVLTPESIIQYAGSFEVLSSERTDRGCRLTAVADDLEMVLDFEELENGYRYEQLEDSGPFEEMTTTITVEPADQDGASRLEANSALTFGESILSFIVDWIGARTRRDELDRLLRNITMDAQSAGPDGATGSEESNETEL